MANRKRFSKTAEQSDEEDIEQPEYEEKNEIGENFDAYYARNIEERNQDNCPKIFLWMALLFLFNLLYLSVAVMFLWLGRFPIIRALLWIRRIFYATSFDNLYNWTFGNPVSYAYGT